MRTDIHRPSVIVPEDYQFVAFEHQKIEGFGDCAAILANREIIRQHMDMTGGNYSGHSHGGNCHVCGAWAIYTILYYHAKTNTYIRTGMDCANKMDMSYGDMNAFRRAIADHRFAKAGIKKAEKILMNNDLLRVLEIAEEFEVARLAEQEAFHARGDEPDYRRADAFNRRWQDAMVVLDIYRKLVKYGSISDAQVNLLRIKVQRHDNYEARQAKFAAERESAAPCPTGRVEVTGTVVKVAQYDSQFGTTWKMTVKAQQGFMVFVSVPSSIPVPERGATVSFKATITPSDNDPKFGFGKRPVAA